jgi:hypothetical protein
MSRIEEIKARCDAALAYEGGTLGEAMQIYYDSVKDIPYLVGEIGRLNKQATDQKEMYQHALEAENEQKTDAPL